MHDVPQSLGGLLASFGLCPRINTSLNRPRRDERSLHTTALGVKLVDWPSARCKVGKRDHYGAGLAFNLDGDMFSTLPADADARFRTFPKAYHITAVEQGKQTVREPAEFSPLGSSSPPWSSDDGDMGGGPSGRVMRREVGPDDSAQPRWMLLSSVMVRIFG